MGVRTDVSELVEAGKAMIELSAELKRVSAELSALSEIDPLTGAIKRRFSTGAGRIGVARGCWAFSRTGGPAEG